MASVAVTFAFPNALESEGKPNPLINWFGFIVFAEKLLLFVKMSECFLLYRMCSLLFHWDRGHLCVSFYFFVQVHGQKLLYRIIAALGGTNFYTLPIRGPPPGFELNEIQILEESKWNPIKNVT